MLKRLTPHAVIILSGMYLVFFLIDRVNRTMNFINNDITKVLLLALCALAVYHAVLMIRANRRAEREAQRRKAEAGRRRPAARTGGAPGRLKP